MTAIFTKKKAPAGCQWQAKGFKYQKFANFKKLFTLLDFGKSNSQNRHIYNVHAFKNPDTNNRGISNIKSGKRVPHMFRTVPIGTVFHAN